MILKNEMAGTCLLIGLLGAVPGAGQAPGAKNGGAVFSSGVYADPAAAEIAMIKRTAEARAQAAATDQERSQANADALRAAAELEVVALQQHILVLDGSPAHQGDFPYEVALVLGDNTMLSPCGATMVTENWVLTAAHCVCPRHPIGTLKIRGGSINLNGGQVYNFKQIAGTDGQPQEAIVCHPNYSPGVQWHDDIAMIQIDGTLPGKPTIQYASSAIEQQMMDSKEINGVVAGWGPTKPSEVASDVLASGDVKVDYNCQQDGVSAVSMLCAGNTRSTNCAGDSGGPLLLKHMGTTYQIGIVAGSSMPCSKTVQGVYTRVAYFAQPFIEQVLNGKPPIQPAE